MIENFYKEKLSWNKRISNVIGKEHSHIDDLILERNPQLSFTEDGKIDLDKIYTSYEEIRTDRSPYNEYYQCLKNTFSLNEINSFCDVGCATGHLVENMLNDCDSCGIENFQYHKDNASEHVKECINVFDIRDEIQEDIKFDLVNCTEVAEHVDPKFLDIFLDNLKKITGKYLILTWSSVYPESTDAPPQHVSCLYFDDVEKLMKFWGFELDQEKTDKFLKESFKYKNFHEHWRESLSIWRVK
jgi:cyclopropane fatty-acyl-phospholipid synthase-like methyltransferase